MKISQVEITVTDPVAAGGHPSRRRVVCGRRFGPSQGRSAMDQRSARDDDARRTAALMGFIVILVLAIAGVVLVRELGKSTILEDCLMSGRRTCAPIEVPVRRP